MSSSQYLLFCQENNELLMFTLKQLDQVTFHSNCDGSAPGIIEILEEEFLDRARQITLWK
ncbi:DNA replication licensing factor mcm2 [Paramuricea clavata]|uniref:DNA replication licensing factor mcm2 n=1 Tax=Paramuricea clavata TaxID=317549 RepID=A0A7D9ELI0_PARCT|nr:DNA replication licensing factor mcm2 [Paramuricea clavata]